MEYKAGLIVRELIAVESSAFVRFSFDLSIGLALHTRHCSFSKTAIQNKFHYYPEAGIA
jgi:hypothetical protein